MPTVHAPRDSAQAFAITIAALASLTTSVRAQSRRDLHAALLATRGANVVTVVARDFAFEMPAVLPAGLTTFEFRNRGRETHHMSIARLDSGRTMAEAVAAMIKLGHNVRPPWRHAIGGPMRRCPAEARTRRWCSRREAISLTARSPAPIPRAIT